MENEPRAGGPSTWRFTYALRRVELERMVAELATRRLTVTQLTSKRRRWPSRKLDVNLVVIGQRDQVAAWLRDTEKPGNAPVGPS